MNVLSSIKSWYLRTFLPFEDPAHPLYSDGSIKYDNELEQEISDYVNEEGLEVQV